MKMIEGYMSKLFPISTILLWKNSTKLWKNFKKMHPIYFIYGYMDFQFLGGLSLHLNHLIASRMANYDWPFGTLPFGLFWSNLDTRDLETYPRTYSGHF